MRCPTRAAPQAPPAQPRGTQPAPPGRHRGGRRAEGPLAERFGATATTAAGGTARAGAQHGPEGTRRSAGAGRDSGAPRRGERPGEGHARPARPVPQAAGGPGCPQRRGPGSGPARHGAAAVGRQKPPP